MDTLYEQYRKEVLDDLKKRVKFSFNEEDFSPSIKVRIGSMISELQALNASLFELKNLQSQIQESKKFWRKPNFLFFLLGIIFLIIFLPLGFLFIFIALLLILFYINKNKTNNIKISELKTQYDMLFKKYNNEMDLLANDILKESSEIYERKINPTITIYHINTTTDPSKPIIIKCPNCGAPISAEILLKQNSKTTGKVKCEYCGTIITVPINIIERL